MIAFRLFAAALVLGSPTALAAQKFQRLYSNDAEASSFLQNDWNRYTENYHPKYALDDDPKTAWVEGAPGNGEGESLTIRFSPLRSARTLRLRIRNGYQASKSLLAANAAPKDVTLSLLDAAGAEIFQTKASLTRTWGWQQVDLTPPANTQLAFVKLRIDSTWPGSRYKDTCISDVQLLVDSDVPYNEKAELAKKGALTAWIKDRKDVAKYFAALPKTFPFAATHFDAQVEFQQTEPSHAWPPGSGMNRPVHAGSRMPAVKGFVPLDQLVSSGKYPPAWNRLFDKAQTERIRQLMKLAQEHGASLGKDWYKPAFRSHVRVPDGLPDHLLDRVADFLNRGNYGLFEAAHAKTDSASLPAEDDGGWHAETSQLRVEFTDSSTAAASGAQVENGPLHVKPQPRIHALYFWQHSVFEERDSYEVTDHVLIFCDEHERPTEMLVLSNEDEGGWSVTAISFALDAKDRVEKVTTREAAFRTNNLDETAEANEFQMTTYSPTTQG